jgi:predicted AlkP superfamily phosphohydrolase/phosphomutase
MSSSRTLVIGVDGATFDLIDPLVRAGCLPTLQRVMAEGAHGPLTAWPAMNSAVSWSSIVTGCNPGKHGVYNFGQEWQSLPQWGHKWHPVTGADRQKDPFWRLLSAAGLQVGVVNVPISYPADRISGFMLSGMDAPSVNSPGFAHPPELYDELRGHGIPYVIDTFSLSVISQRAPFRLPDQIRDMVAVRARALLHLMRARSWDVLMGVFVATDRVQHCYWPDMQAPVDHPSWNSIRLLYQQIDAFLVEVLARAGADTTVLIVSDHGFTHSRTATRCLNPLFARLGLLSYRHGAGERKEGPLGTLLRQGRRFLPYRLQYPLAKMLPGLHLRAVGASREHGIDWAQTQVYAIAATGGQVFINRQGEGSQGTVAPAAYDSLRERVIDILLHLVDPQSGRRVIKQALRREDVYKGPHVDGAPDIVLDWEYSALSDALCYPVGNEPVTVDAPKRSEPSTGWKGTHHPEGVLIACGPHVRPGVELADAHIYDVAPTILYLQDQPIPEDMDGRVLTEIFREGYVQEHPPRKGSATESGLDSERLALGADEERLIEERLRGLGYL